MRLLYVAATRARDHLVVSLHRGKTPRARRRGRTPMHLAERWRGDRCGCRAAGVGRRALAPGAQRAIRHPSPGPRAVARTGSRLRGCQPPGARAERLGPGGHRPRRPRRRIAMAGRPLTQSGAWLPTQRSRRTRRWPPGSPRAPVTWSSRPGPRAATAQPSAGPSTGCCSRSTCATGAGLEDAVAAQCLAEGVVEFTDLVTALVRSALAHEVVQRAAAREHWRESYVGTVQEDGTRPRGLRRPHLPRGRRLARHRRLQDRRHPRRRDPGPHRLLPAPARRLPPDAVRRRQGHRR